jgi:hypothetical protein
MGFLLQPFALEAAVTSTALCERNQVCGGSMMAKVSMWVVVVILTWSVRADAITWCHDYALAQVVQGDYNRLTVDQLRAALRQNRFTATSYPAGTPSAAVEGTLRPGDVLIFGNRHSGVVTGDRRITHYIQDIADQVVTTYTPATVASAPNYRAADALETIRSFRREGVHENGTRFVVEPYKNVGIEVWRASFPDVSGTWRSNFGAVSIVQDGARVQGIMRYANGNQGQLSGILRFDRSGVFCDGSWNNAEGSGHFGLRLSSDSRSFNGRWTESRTNRSAAWNLSR